MHERNPYYHRKPDFAALAQEYPAFAAFLIGNRELDWSNPAALIELCRTLLHHDFGVRWTMPEKSLCPTVPSRLDYLLWVDDLLTLTQQQQQHHHHHHQRRIIGIDVGTGASCIYPLLGHAHLGWDFVATEVDPASVSAARHNVTLNGWTEAIQVRQVEADASVESGVSSLSSTSVEELAPILLGVIRPSERFDFCMCNPPWFAPSDVPRPNAHHAPNGERCNATASEVFTSGGEVGFIQRMVHESAALRERITWYTSLVGRKVSLAPVLRVIRAAGAVHVRTTEMVQGVTSRWAVAWSFVPEAACTLQPPAKPTKKVFDAPEGVDVAELKLRVVECLSSQQGQIGDEGENEGAEAVLDQGTKDIAKNQEEDETGRSSERGERQGRTPVQADRRHVIARRRFAGSASAHGHDGGGKRKKARKEGATSPEPATAMELATGTKSAEMLPSTLSEFVIDVSLLLPAQQESDQWRGFKVEVSLVSTTRGEASSAFWRLAEQVRNDVVRDTRKWRRLAMADGGKEDSKASSLTISKPSSKSSS